MKKLLISFFRHIGYEIIKTPRKRLFRKDLSINVSGIDLTIPSHNPLVFEYKKNAEFSYEIGRIAASVAAKYPKIHIIDIGANVGDSAAILSSAVTAPITSFEGDKSTFAYLKKNTSKMEMVEAVCQFLSDKDESMNITTEKEGWNTTLIPTDNEGKVINFQRLDSAMTSRVAPVNKVKFIKTDTEGFDAKILRGSLNIIKADSPIIYLEYNRQNLDKIKENGLSILSLLKTYGYEDVLFFDDRGKYLLSTQLSNENSIYDLHSYSDGETGLISYYNLCVFHKEDKDLATIVRKNELHYWAQKAK